MATRSYILKENDDGTFSGRYHHWDGYPDGVGIFLHTYINTSEKVKWLFDLNRSFSSIQRAKSYPGLSGRFAEDKYDQSKKDNCAIDYPASFKAPDNVYIGAHPEKDQGGLFSSLPWKKANEEAQESYTYLFKNNTWYVLLSRLEDFCDCKMVPVFTLLNLQSAICQTKESLDETFAAIERKNKKSDPRDSWSVSTKKEMVNCFKMWAEKDAEERQDILWAMKEEYDMKEQADLFNQFAFALSSKDDLEKSLKTKPKNSRQKVPKL